MAELEEGTLVRLAPGEEDYQDANPTGYSYAVNWLNDRIEGLSKEQAGAYVRAQAEAFRDANGFWPSSGALFDMPNFIQGASAQLGNLGTLPGTFMTENGIYKNDPLTGLTPIFNVPLFVQQQLPYISEATLQARLQPVSFGGGGGGGGGGLAGLVLDREKVKDVIRENWRSWMREEPDDLEALANSFISEAKAFRRKGGSLDINTWTKGKMRGTSRYRILYGKKPESQTEEQYQGGFNAVVTQFGFNAQATDREVEAGLRSGAGLAGFADRVGRTREASLQTPFTQKMVEAVSNLGPLLAS
jgi:hypothetical protein